MKREAERLCREFREKLLKAGQSPGIIQEKQYNHEFNASDGSGKVKVQVYFGKKGIKTVLQGNSDSYIYSIAEQIMQGGLKRPDPAIGASGQGEITESYIGSDESGKGDIFGPLCVCAFFLDAEQRESMRNLGVRDSKLLSDTAIKSIAAKLMTEYSGQYEVLRIVPEEYNALYGKFKNLNKLLRYLHEEAINRLLKKNPTGLVIIDKFSSLDITLKSGITPPKIVQITKAEKYAAVAAASILARYSFSSWFNEKPQDELLLQKGASTAVSKMAQEIYHAEGADFIKKIAKFHFKTFQDLQFNRKLTES